MAARLKKNLGQHLLNSPSMLRSIVAAAGVQPGDNVLEIGPGPGNLTRLLVEAVGPDGRVMAVELDRDWKDVLEALQSEHAALRIEWGDFLTLDLAALLATGSNRDAAPWKVVANLPYYITAPILEKVMTSWGRFSCLALLVQKEVARRIHARSGREVGAISYFVHFHYDTEVPFEVPAAAFIPPPQVDSALLLLKPRALGPVEAPPSALFPIIHAAFAGRRKMLRRSLRGLPGMSDAVFEAAGVAGDRRPEELTLEEFSALAGAYQARTGGPVP